MKIVIIIYRHWSTGSKSFSYVDLNPVTAGMVARAEDYPWSSYQHRIGEVNCHWLDLDACYLGLKHPQTDYRHFVEKGIAASERQSRMY